MTTYVGRTALQSVNERVNERVKCLRTGRWMQGGSARGQRVPACVFLPMCLVYLCVIPLPCTHGWAWFSVRTDLWSKAQTFIYDFHDQFKKIKRKKLGLHASFSIT